MQGKARGGFGSALVFGENSGFSEFSKNTGIQKPILDFVGHFAPMEGGWITLNGVVSGRQITAARECRCAKFVRAVTKVRGRRGHLDPAASAIHVWCDR